MLMIVLMFAGYYNVNVNSTVNVNANVKMTMLRKHYHGVKLKAAVTCSDDLMM